MRARAYRICVRAPVLTMTFACAAACVPEPDPSDTPPGEGEGEVDACEADTNKPLPALTAAVYDGTRAPSLLPLDRAQQDAVVGLTDAGTFGAFCSGTLIAGDV